MYTKSKEFIIYLTNSAIRLDMDDDDPEINTHKTNHLKIGVDLARIYSWLPESLSWSEPINKQIARAMTTNILGNYSDAKRMLEHAEDRIIKLKTIQGRIQYTLSVFLAVLVISILILLFPHCEADTLSTIMLCGDLGGVLSIAMGYSSLTIDIMLT